MNNRENVLHGVWSLGSDTATEMKRLGILDAFVDWAVRETDIEKVTDLGIALRAHGFLAGWKLAEDL